MHVNWIISRLNCVPHDPQHGDHQRDKLYSIMVVCYVISNTSSNSTGSYVEKMFLCSRNIETEFLDQLELIKE